MKKELSEYDKQALDFLELTNTEIVPVLIGHGKYFDNDKESRDIYQISINKKSPNTRIEQVASFKFGNSINDSGFSLNEGIHYWDKKRMRRKPSAYSVLAGLTKNDPGSFSSFCDDYGYDKDYIKAQKVYFAVQEEWEMVQRVYGEYLDQLQAIN